MILRFVQVLALCMAVFAITVQLIEGREWWWYAMNTFTISSMSIALVCNWPERMRH